ncbi:MAG: YncE family protein [Planctomycetota bacterium]
MSGRIDHLAVDLARQHLFVAALGNDSVEVCDLAKGVHLAHLEGTREPQGIVYLPAQDRVVVASGEDGNCDAYDGATFERVGRVHVGGDVDNLRVDAAHGNVVAAYGSGALAVIDATTFEVTARVELPAHPEGFQLATDGARAFVNVPGARAVVAVDLEHRRVEATFALDEARSNFPMALVPPAKDGAPTLLAVGCRAPAALLLRDASNGGAVQRLELSGDADDLFFDAARGAVYAACGGGSIDVFERGDDRFLAQRDDRQRLHRAHVPVRASSTACSSPHRRAADGAEVRVYACRDTHARRQ